MSPDPLQTSKHVSTNRTPRKETPVKRQLLSQAQRLYVPNRKGTCPPAWPLGSGLTTSSSTLQHAGGLKLSDVHQQNAKCTAKCIAATSWEDALFNLCVLFNKSKSKTGTCFPLWVIRSYTRIRYYTVSYSIDSHSFGNTATISDGGASICHWWCFPFALCLSPALEWRIWCTTRKTPPARAFPLCPSKP